MVEMKLQLLPSPSPTLLSISPFLWLRVSPPLGEDESTSFVAVARWRPCRLPSAAAAVEGSVVHRRLPERGGRRPLLPGRLLPVAIQGPTCELRSTSSSDIFGRSSREEDDEEALRWVALEKLPTYDRLRKGILTGAGGEVREVEIQDLGYQERRNLLEMLVRNAEEDNEMFLLKLRNRMERVGIDNPMIEVRFERLNIDAEAYIGTRGIPTFLNFFVNKTMGLLSFLRLVPSGKRPISILHDISGIIRPCRMTLLLGPPGSGKTTLLLAPFFIGQQPPFSFVNI